MSETEIAIVKAHLENIREDISELKEGYKKITELLGKLIFLEDKFKANDESHRLLWGSLNDTKKTVAEHDKTAAVVSKWEKRIDKVVVGITIVAIVQFVTFLIFILRKF